MHYYLLLFLAAIGAGFSLLYVTGVAAAGFLGPLAAPLAGLAVIVIVVFSLVIFYLAVKELLHRRSL
ncbi:hypothetical protein FZC84_11275 [Rossellomorea vietnamensis]|uniref:Uncharacterized protein n=1 Tax=Rossellomorea vietnamensis TaxID=218284 RepID=A0A5D4MCW6_9BACI|nr:MULTISPECIES: hypothetical protein [Bacillaceae]TYR99328.1 hypothetical protein FZC84_11275 [Rossellomorea vietnamensis]